jgi:hypothetical protein
VVRSSIHSSVHAARQRPARDAAAAAAAGAAATAVAGPGLGATSAPGGRAARGAARCAHGRGACRAPGPGCAMDCAWRPRRGCACANAPCGRSAPPRVVEDRNGGKCRCCGSIIRGPTRPKPRPGIWVARTRPGFWSGLVVTSAPIGAGDRGGTAYYDAPRRPPRARRCATGECLICGGALRHDGFRNRVCMDAVGARDESRHCSAAGNCRSRSWQCPCSERGWPECGGRARWCGAAGPRGASHCTGRRAVDRRHGQLWRATGAIVARGHSDANDPSAHVPQRVVRGTRRRPHPSSHTEVVIWRCTHRPRSRTLQRVVTSKYV